MAVSFKIIGRHIQAARKKCNLTQEQVAEAMEISAAHYGRLERGEREVNIERLAEISVLLQVPMEKFVEGCVPEVSALAEDGNNEPPFVNQMKRYAQMCSTETLQRMLRVCSVLAEEDQEVK